MFCFLHWCGVFHRNSLEWNGLFRWKTSVKEANYVHYVCTEVILAKTGITIDYLAARLKRRSLWNGEIHSATEIALNSKATVNLRRGRIRYLSFPLGFLLTYLTTTMTEYTTNCFFSLHCTTVWLFWYSHDPPVPPSALTMLCAACTVIA